MTKRVGRRLPRSQQRLAQQGPALASRAAPRRADGRGRSWIGSLLLCGLSLFLLVTFLTDARFRVAQVEVSGVTLLAPGEIEAEADLVGRPIFAVDTRRIERELLAGFGCLARVRARTRLPDRVEIRVVEKEALILWESGGTYWWVDAQGRVLGLARSRGHLSAVHDRSGLPVVEGGYLVGVPWALVGEMRRALPEVRDFEFTLEDGLILIVEQGWPVYLGTEGDAQQKAALLRELQRSLAASGGRVVYVDLKNERRPFVKVQPG